MSGGGRAPHLDLDVRGRLWGRISQLPPALEAALETAAGVLDRDFGGASLAIRLTNDREVQSLNAAYRGKDKPTNVLSFPDPDGVEGGHIGDLALARETVFREADVAGIARLSHLTHLAVHGFLHCLGYDHILDDDADIMERLEIDILARLGIDDPYAGGDAAPDA